MPERPTSALHDESVLPDAPLVAPGPNSDALRRVGCHDYRGAAALVRALPYGRNRDRSDPRLVLVEGRGTCSTKHALLAAVAREQALPVELVIGIYDLCEANTPGVGAVLAAHGLESIPEAHCYLRHAGLRVDVTRSEARPEAPIARFHREWTIEPAQIGAHKEALHRRHLQQWLAERPALALSLEDLWRIREACIAALGAGGR